MSQADDFLAGPGQELVDLVNSGDAYRVDRVFDDGSVLVVERDKDGNVVTSVMADATDYDTHVDDATPTFDASGALTNSEEAV